MDEAQRAANQEPSSREFAVSNGHLLCDALETSKNSKDYQEFEKECEQALSNKEPNVEADSQSKTGRTREERIAVARQNLQALLKKARDAYSGAQTKSLKLKQSDSVTSKIASPSLPMPTRPLEQSNLNKILYRGETTGRLPELWRSWAVEEKRTLLQLRIVDLNKYFVSLQDNSAAKTFSEAISFAHKYKTWKFWPCFICDDKFYDPEQRKKHLALRHNAKFPETGSGPAEFDKVDASWADKLVEGTWRPVDTSRVVKSIQEKSKCEEHSAQKWPVADDKHRAALLEEIHGVFKEILLKDWITMDQLKLLVDSAVYELGIIIPKSQILDHALDQTHFCFCFLEAPQLEQIHHYLLLVSNSAHSDYYLFSRLINLINKCELAHSDYNLFSRLINRVNNCEVSDIKERVVISDDMSCLCLDERLLTGELTMEKYDEVVAYDASAATGTISYDRIDIPPDVDSFLYWLSAVPSAGEVLCSWKSLIDIWKNMGRETFHAFDTVGKVLDGLNKGRSEVSKMEGLLRTIENVHNKRLKMMKQGAKHARQSVASAFWKETKQIYESNPSDEKRVTADAISNLIKASITLNIDLTSTNSLSRDTECSDHIHPQDARFQIVLQRQLNHSSLQISHLSSRIMRLERLLQQLKAKIEQVSYIDYRGILLPLLKFFIQEHFQALLENDAKQRSDAAMEALLEQVAEESIKNINKGGSQASQEQQKSKAKKKTKPCRRLDSLEEMKKEPDEDNDEPILGMIITRRGVIVKTGNLEQPTDDGEEAEDWLPAPEIAGRRRRHTHRQIPREAETPSTMTRTENPTGHIRSSLEHSSPLFLLEDLKSLDTCR